MNKKPKFIKINKKDIENGIDIVHSKEYLVFRERLIQTPSQTKGGKEDVV